jgi:hypothetical protein
VSLGHHFQVVGCRPLHEFANCEIKRGLNNIHFAQVSIDRKDINPFTTERKMSTASQQNCLCIFSLAKDLIPKLFWREVEV